MSTATLKPLPVPVSTKERSESLTGIAIDSSELFPSQETQSHLVNSLSDQLPQLNQEPTYLQVSPYPEREHQLDLNSLDLPNRLLALALTALEPITPTYATTAYAETFNWSSVFTKLRQLAQTESFHFPRTEFYVVEFRSKLKETIDNNLLFTLDKQSHREATAAGGLLKYWFGSPDAERRNLATCLWRGKEDAIEGGKGPWHKQARAIIGSTYESIDVRGLVLVIDEGAGTWSFKPWSFR